jgi:hypothetical protein
MKFSDSPLIIKILAFLCIPAMLFIIMNMILAAYEIYGKIYIREIDIILRNGLPFFLFLTGSFIRNKKLRIPLVIFFPLVFIGYAIKMLDYYDVVDMNVKWILCPAVFGLLLTYSIHFFAKKQKSPLDYLKMLWLLLVSYILLSVYFSGIGIRFKYFNMIILFEAVPYLMLLLMCYGLFEYFRKPEEENNF